MSPTKPRLLILSDVLPFPGQSGQQQRVALKLQALRVHFHLTFLTSAEQSKIKQVQENLLKYCDEAIVIASVHKGKPFFVRLLHRIKGFIFTVRTGLKFSNYRLSELDFTIERIEAALQGQGFAGVIYEYFHAYPTTELFRRQAIPTILDMHDILWKSYSRQLDSQKWVPSWWKERQISRYRAKEEEAWLQFTAIIAINAGEMAYVQVKAPNTPCFYAPMGVDLSQWPYQWEANPEPRIAYYGGLGSRHNQQDALWCYEKVMPLIWQKLPDAELWLIGSNPPPFLKKLAENDKRVKVTGFVEDVKDVLKTIYLILCPWSGQYGFRSRIIEVMALGLPVITTSDAIHGMDLYSEAGLFLQEDEFGMAENALKLLADKSLATQASQAARQQVQAKFSFEASYGKLSRDLLDFCGQAKNFESFAND